MIIRGVGGSSVISHDNYETPLLNNRLSGSDHMEHGANGDLTN